MKPSFHFFAEFGNTRQGVTIIMIRPYKQTSNRLSLSLIFIFVLFRTDILSTSFSV